MIVAHDHLMLKVSTSTYAGGTMLLRTLVVTWAKAMKASVRIVKSLEFIVVENTATGSELPVAAVTSRPIKPMNKVTGRIARV